MPASIFSFVILRQQLWHSILHRLRPENMWAHYFLQARTDDSSTFRSLALIDEYARECLAI